MFYNSTAQHSTAQHSTERSGVSVIIPVYNREKYLKECINSVISQDVDFPLEIILADDGSTDGSKEVGIDSVISQDVDFPLKIILADDGATNESKEDEYPRTIFDSSACWIDKPVNCSEQGAGSTRNRGIAAAKYDYIAFLDSDDVFLPGHLKRLFDFLEAHPEFGGAVDQVCGFSGDIENRWLARSPEKDEVKLFTFFLNPYTQLNVTMLRKNIIGESAIQFESSLRFAEDIDFLLRVLEKHRVANLPEPGAAYREHTERSTAGSAKQYEYAWLALEHATRRYSYPAWLVRKRKAAIAFRLAQGDIAEKKYIPAIKRLLYAGLLDPVRAIKVVLQMEK
ncbi:hypothetical protein FACS1894170_02520 [Planctomycetales bacterium]|nr:hypothetical protein FACS1894170_02520 [Planctomycetales bacterium]